MKQLIITSVKQILADRAIASMCIGIIVAVGIYIAYVALSLSVTDRQIATRYTAFGETHLYVTQWYYLLSFIGFALIFLIAHIGMMIKLYVSDLRQFAFTLGWLSVVIIILMFVYTFFVLRIAYPS